MKKSYDKKLTMKSEASLSTSSIPPPPHLDHEMVSLNLFFLAYGAGRDKDATCSLLEILPDLYVRCHVGSSLALATAALAIKVTGLWSLRDVDPVDARQRYAQAVSSAKEAIKDPLQSISDDLLMTTLVLGAYEGLCAVYQGHPNPNIHLAGALALVRHRGQLNYRDSFSQRILLASRNMFAQDVLRMPRIADAGMLWQDAGPMPESPAIEVDRLAFRLSELSGRVHSEDYDDTKGIEESSTPCEAAALVDACTAWVQYLPPHWQPVKLDAGEVESSREAGVYAETCHLYANLSIAYLWNRHRLVELYALLLLRIYARQGQDLRQASSITSRMHAIVDDICASVPYHMGDLMEPASTAKSRVEFSHVVLDSTPWGDKPISQHERQITASGAMSIYQVLKTVVALARNVHDRARIILPDGQMGWIMIQVSRLQIALHLPGLARQ